MDACNAANPRWPNTLWLAGDGHNKRRTTHSEDGAVAYVLAADYEELMEWARTMIVEGEVCPCGMPAPNKRAPLHEPEAAP